MSKWVLLWLLSAQAASVMSTSIECMDMFHHFEDSGMSLVYGSQTDMIKLMCNYTLDFNNATLEVKWSLNDVVQSTYMIGGNDTNFMDAWADATGMNDYEEDILTGMSMVEIPIHTLQRGVVDFMLVDALTNATEEEHTMNITVFDVSSMSLELQLTEIETTCDQPLMFNVSWTAVHHMCLNIHTMAGDAMPTCQATTRGDGMCMKQCETDVMEPEIMIMAMPHHSMMDMMTSMMSNATLMSNKGSRCMFTEESAAGVVTEAPVDPGVDGGADGDSADGDGEPDAVVTEGLDSGDASSTTAAATKPVATTKKVAKNKSGGSKKKTQSSDSTDKKSKSKKKKGLAAWAIALIVIGIAVFGAVGAAGFMMHQKRQQAEGGESKPADAETPKADGPSEEAGKDGVAPTASSTSAANADKSSLRQGSVRQGSVRQGSVRQGSARGAALSGNKSTSSAVTADVQPDANPTNASIDASS